MTGVGHIPRHRSRTTRAQALVEFALVAPIFFILLFGIIEGGRFMFYYEILNNATREGARYAIVNGANSLICPSGPPAPQSTPCDTAGQRVIDRVRGSALGVLTGITVTPVWHDPADNGRGSTITVSATYSYTSLVPLLPLPTITVTAESSLVINN
jgi:hypothetical protein